MLLIGWSILVLSFVMHFVHPSWDYAGNWNTSTVLAMVFINVADIFLMLAGVAAVLLLSFVNPAPKEKENT